MARGGREILLSNELLGACAHLQMAPSPKAVLMSLADQANGDGVSWPSVGSLAEYTCLSERTVQRALSELQAAGFVSWRKRRDDSNVYQLAKWTLLKLKAAHDAAREARRAAEAASKPTGDTVTPLGCHGDTPGVSTGVMVTPQGCHGDTQTTIEPNTGNTPHTPLPSAGGRATAAEAPAKPKRREGAAPVALKTWLDSLPEGEAAIPEGDPVFAYAATVGISHHLIALLWAEFKRRMAANHKRQRDWRRTFRNYAEANYWGLWSIRPGEPAVLTSRGEQVQRWVDAQAKDQQQATDGQEGEAP